MTSITKDTSTAFRSEPPPQWRWFLQSTNRAIPRLAELMIIAVAFRLIELIQPFVFQALVDKILPFYRLASLQLILVILVGSTLFAAAFSALYNLLAASIANSLTFEMGARVFEHVIRLPLARMQKYAIGDTIARIGEIDRVREALTGTVATSVVDLLFVVLYLMVLFSISPQLTAVIAVATPVQVLLFSAMGPFLRARLQERFTAHSDHYSRLVETFGAMVVVKSLDAEPAFLGRIMATLQRGLAADWRVAKLQAANGAIGQALSGISVVLVIYLGAGLVFANQITLGQLIAFHLIAANISGPMLSLATLWEKWQGVKISRARLGDFINAAPESEPRRPTLPCKPGARLVVDRVSFSYDDSRQILTDLTLTFPPKGLTLIVGDSGCGKSTLGKLLVGLLNPTDGRICYGDDDISGFDPGSVRRRLAYVPQEPTLYVGTVRENILLSKPDATAEELREALSVSACDRFLPRLSAGLDTPVGPSGCQLSGGQRQRVALARSLLVQPDALVIDEPTSSLDEESARAVIDALYEVAQDRPVILITHRPDLGITVTVHLIDGLSRCV